MRITLLALIAILTPLMQLDAAPPVEEIIRNAIAKLEADKQICSTYTNNTITQSIKYDKNMQPDEVTVMNKRSFHINKRIAEQIFSIEKDGKMMTPKEIEKRAEEQTKKWEDEHKEGGKARAASRENYVDPLTVAGIDTYSYHLIETRDSAFGVVSAAVAGTTEIIDQSVQKLTTYYVIQVLAKIADEKHLNATYWIDAKTFGVLRTEFTPSKMPRFVEMLDFQLDYEILQFGDSTLYFPRRFELKGKAGFLFYKGRFGAIEEYSDYRCEDAIDESLFKTRYFYKPGEGPKP